MHGRKATALAAAAGIAACVVAAVAALAISDSGPFAEGAEQGDLAALTGPKECGPATAQPSPARAATPGAPLIARRPDGRLPIGFNDGAYLAGQATPEQSAAIQRAAGSSIWRSVAQWQAIEPEPGSYDFSTTDPVYCAALAAGIAPLFHITTTPDWATDPALPCGARCVSPPLPEHYDNLRRFAAAIAARYPRSIAIEAWNEPNLHLFWEQPDPGRYVEVLREVDAGVESVDPRIPVLLGGLSPVVAGDPATGDLALDGYVRALYQDGAAQYFDAVNVHVYPASADEAPAEAVARILGTLRRLIATEDGTDGRRIWVTELGVPAGTGVTRAAQADQLIDYYQQLDRAADVDAVLFHTPVEPNARIVGGAGYGWVTQPDAAGEYRPFPVLCRFAALLAEPVDCGAPMPP